MNIEFTANGESHNINVGQCVEDALVKIFEPVAHIEMLKRKDFLTSREVESLYGISESTLRSMRSRKCGPKFFQCGKDGPVRYAHSNIRDYINGTWNGGGNALSS